MPEPLIYPVAPPFPSGPDVPLYRWGTVVQVSPLRVRLDGDDTPLLSDPWDMAGPRSAGERVYIQIAGRRVVLLGPTTRPSKATNLSSLLNTSLWDPYDEAPAIEAIRWGPWIEITGEVKCKTGHPWIGETGVVTSSHAIMTGVPPEWQIRMRGNTISDAGQNRQQMTSSGSWYVFPRGPEVYGTRVNAVSTISTGTWFPFRICGFAVDAF